ncbi:hypothetical protein HPP92_012085 [Vanilla planifolia]|uniref:HSF-type DNA-binding domain-containing protein n=1 Tax=Vanilla planifolia TaxID=51239 RepID=A0A835V5M9_VANPL|nr:hypothetical protein HPP92_012457 [Vanilla planifolia]KAG0484001.1 hypothetical protein HPP92_012085 [Vanilla planifolia]
MAFLVKYREMVVSVKSQKSVPAPFLTKTYQLVDDPCTNHIVSWGEDATTFVVWRPPEFARDVLPNYFKHNNFSSFVRQLNTYGFRKIVADRWEFANEFFRKGETNLLTEIHRRKTPQVLQNYYNHHQYNSQASFPGQEEMGSWIEPPLAPQNGDTKTIIAALSEDNERLRRKNSYLLAELTNMRKLYNDIMSFTQYHLNPLPTEQSLVNSSCRLVEINPCHHPTISLTGMKFSINELSVNGSEKLSKTPDGSIKLFGIPLKGNKRLHQEMGGQRESS